MQKSYESRWWLNGNQIISILFMDFFDKHYRTRTIVVCEQSEIRARAL